MELVFRTIRHRKRLDRLLGILELLSLCAFASAALMGCLVFVLSR